MAEPTRSPPSCSLATATRHVVCLVAFLVTLATVTGCLRGPQEEAEHEEPAHRPIDFPAAVARLRVLHERLLADAPAASGELDPIVEWSAVVAWLPELAADSDLAETPWNQVRDLARDLAALNGVALPLTGGNGAEPTEVPADEAARARGAYRASGERAGALIEQLAALAEREAAAFPRPVSAARQPHHPPRQSAGEQP